MFHTTVAALGWQNTSGFLSDRGNHEAVSQKQIRQNTHIIFASGTKTFFERPDFLPNPPLPLPLFNALSQSVKKRTTLNSRAININQSHHIKTKHLNQANQMTPRQVSLTQIKSTKQSITQRNNETIIESNQCITQALKQLDKPNHPSNNQPTNQSNKLKQNENEMKPNRHERHIKY